MNRRVQNDLSSRAIIKMTRLSELDNGFERTGSKWFSGGHLPIGYFVAFPGSVFQQNLTKLWCNQVLNYCSQAEFFN